MFERCVYSIETYKLFMSVQGDTAIYSCCKQKKKLALFNGTGQVLFT